jgi:hypothetical protein
VIILTRDSKTWLCEDEDEDEDEDEGAEADRKDRYREKAATAKLGVEIAKP